MTRRAVRAGEHGPSSVMVCGSVSSIGKAREGLWGKRLHRLSPAWPSTFLARSNRVRSAHAPRLFVMAMES